MFNQFKTWLNITALCLILGLCVWLWGQHQTVLHLRAENLTQAQAIEEQRTVNQQLTVQLEQEREAVEIQQQIANELREQVETKRESIKTILVKEPCSRTAMPRAVIEQLRQTSGKD